MDENVVGSSKRIEPIKHSITMLFGKGKRKGSPVPLSVKEMDEAIVQAVVLLAKEPSDYL